MLIRLFHTAQVHVATFDAVFAALDPDVRLEHHVVPVYLDLARAEGLEAVRPEVTQTLREMARADAALCTCSTLGPIADALSLPNVLRIDRPLMEAALNHGPDLVVALCLESTREATLGLLRDCAARRNKVIQPRLVTCGEAWPLFERGDMDGYALSIANAIRADVAKSANTDAIILAQASMRVAEPALADLGVPVLSAPEIAARACLRIANGQLG